MLTLLPAVDVADGQAVRLVQGAAGSETAYGDPLDAALAWQRDGAGWVHLVDLDAAFGRGSNAALLARVVGALDVQVELSGWSASTATGWASAWTYAGVPSRRAVGPGRAATCTRCWPGWTRPAVPAT